MRGKISKEVKSVSFLSSETISERKKSLQIPSVGPKSPLNTHLLSSTLQRKEAVPMHEEKLEINLRIEEEDDDDSDYDGYQKELKLKKDIKAKRQRDLKDIKFGNRQSKVIAFHKGSGEIHDTDREKGSSIMANLDAQLRSPRISGSNSNKPGNPFQKRKANEQMLDWDGSSLLKMG